MKKTLIGGGIVIIALVLIFAFGPDEEKQEQIPAAQQAVLDEISSMTDCNELQERFETSFGHWERNDALDKRELARISLQYMKATDDRMREIGCYK